LAVLIFAACADEPSARAKMNGAARMRFMARILLI
jgi:hypothetical protein